MTKKTFSIILTALSIIAYSQVGIKTEKPIGIFNIDGQKDNAGSLTPTAAQQLNDVVVLSNGNTGLGTTTPTQKLDIVTGGTASAPKPDFRIEDGSQGTDYYLVSDANGVGSWKFLGATRPTIISGAIGTSIIKTDDASTSPTIYSGLSITLPKGKWLVNVGFNATITANIANRQSYWLHSYLSSNSVTRTQTGLDILGANTTANMDFGAMLIKSTVYDSTNFFSGSSVVVVNDPSVTLYVLIENAKLATYGATTGNMWQLDPTIGDTYLYAMPVNE